MNLLPTLLWKEWRDHRAALIGYCVGVPPLIAWGLSALSATRRVDPLLPAAAAVGGIAIAALTLFGDLFAGEEQRGTIKLLRRLPSGLSKIFLAKLLFLLMATALMGGVAWLATTTAAAALYGAPFAPRLSLPARDWLVLLFPLIAWIPAAAIWLSRATLALPAAALTLALFAAPVGFAVWLQPWLAPSKGELLVAYVVVTAAGPFIAGASFVLGRRRSTRPFTPAAVGLLATLALFVPAYGWTGVRFAKGLVLEPAAATFRIATNSAGAVSQDGRFAWINAFHVAGSRNVAGITDYDPERDGPLHTVQVDLADGRWRPFGSLGAMVLAPGSLSERRNAAVVGLFRDSALRRRDINHDDHERDETLLLDAVTGEPLEATARAALLAKRGAAAGALLREACGLVLPDGRRVWRQDDQLMIDPGRVLPDSRCLESGWTSSFWSSGNAGFGVRVAERELYDPSREKRFRVAPELAVLFVRPGHWVVYGWDPKGKRGTLAYDPESGATAPLLGSEPNDFVSALLPDGRLLVRARLGSGRDAEPALVLLDPETGAREELALELPPEALGMVWQPTGTDDGALVATLWGANVARFLRIELPADRRSGERARVEVTAPLELPCESIGVVGADGQSVIAIEAGRRLVRVRFDGSPPEQLFPK
ncbi:MAG: ABC transporter permease [Planctomycetes bacterium]|nr:ABC transporter permease [Planctomycetota bacterium]